MKRLCLLVLLLPVFAVADDITVTSTDGLTKTITATATGPTGPTGPAGPAGPAFTGGTLTTAVLGAAANNCAAIPFGFASDATTGMCSTAAGTINLYTSASSRLALNSTTATFTVPVLAANGSLTAPSVSFASAAFDGMRWVSGVNGGLYIQSEGPNLSINMDNGHDSAGARAGLNMNASDGFVLTHLASATKYSSVSIGLLAAATNVLIAHDGAADNRVTQTTTKTTFDHQIELTGLPAVSGCTTKALTDAAAAVSFARVAVATNGHMAGEFEWTATTTDGTDQIMTFGRQPIVGVDKAGTVTCATSAQYATTTAATNANTLVCTVTTVTSTTNCDAQVTCTNNTAGDQAISFCWRFDQPIATTVVVP